MRDTVSFSRVCSHSNETTNHQNFPFWFYETKEGYNDQDILDIVVYPKLYLASSLVKVYKGSIVSIKSVELSP